MFIMKFMFTLTTFVCLFFSSLVGALPAVLQSREVIDPPITSPNTSTVWHSGETATVTWDASVVPPPFLGQNFLGTIELGYLNNTDEHLLFDLASGFNLADGNVSFVVPSLPTRDDYIIVLFGDSGNVSPSFTIIGTD